MVYETFTLLARRKIHLESIPTGTNETLYCSRFLSWNFFRSESFPIHSSNEKGQSAKFGQSVLLQYEYFRYHIIQHFLETQEYRFLRKLATIC